MSTTETEGIKQCHRCGHHCAEHAGYCEKCGAQVAHIKCEPWTLFDMRICVQSRCRDYKDAQAQLRRAVAHMEYEALSIVGTSISPLTQGHRLTWHHDREGRA